jgi:hypothetical protein
MVAGETLSQIEELNKRIEEAGQQFKLAVVDVEELSLLEKNARYMTNEQFSRLVSNIKRDGGLSSVPFCYKEGDRYKVLSGNHRVMAAREAGLKQVLIMYTDKEMTKAEQTAVQLSHNAIVGQDDPAILKELWNEINDVDLKMYSGLDDKILDELKKVTIEPLSEVKLDFRTMSFLFLPSEIERVKEIFQEAAELCGGDEIYAARLEEFNRMLAAISKTNAAYNIKNAATSLMIILDIFENHLTDLAEGWTERETSTREWVPLASIIGTENIPVEAAQIIQRAVQKMMDRGEITKKNLWQALEYWAANYLAGE